MNKPLYTISGRVIRGAGYGKKLGFPTANLDHENYAAAKIDIPFGVYAGTARILSGSGGDELRMRDFPAGIVIGPKEASCLPKIEAYLLDFSGDLYGKILELKLFEFLRPFQQFESENALKAHIQKDVEKVRSCLFNKQAASA